MFRRGKKRQRIFIFPTLYGFVYGGGALTCLLCGMAYLNNLAYLLCFFLVSLFIIGMHQSNNNLKDIYLEKIEFPEIPAGLRSVGKIWFKSKSGMDHSSLEFSAPLWSDEKKEGSLTGKVPLLKAHSQNIYSVAASPKARGEKKIKRIKVFSRFPFGLFYVWRYFNLNYDLYVFPEPVPSKQKPVYQKTGDESQSTDNSSDGQDFKEHKLYQLGDSQKRIDWKAFARGRPLLTKKFEEGYDGHFHLEAKGSDVNFEKKLSELTYWVFYYDQNHHPYSMSVPQFDLKQGLGHSHRRRSLKALALSKAKS